MKNIGDPYWHSENVKKSVANLAQKVANGDFLESDIKALILDLREFARQKQKAYIVKQKSNNKSPLTGEDGEFLQLYSDFVDLADFIAHPNREQGVLHDKMVQNALVLAQAARENRRPTPQENAKCWWATYFCFMMLLCTEGFLQIELSENFNKKFSAQHPDIELCILLLLQDTRITLKGGLGFVLNNIRPANGKFNLSARLFGSEANGILQAKLDQDVLIQYSVIFTEASVPADFVVPDHADFPPVYEGYRNHLNQLRIRPIIMPHDLV